MNGKRLMLLLIALALLVASLPAAAQDVDTEEANPNAQITFPPPVYVVRGEFEIRGSANLSDMTTYFIEFRPLNDDLTSPEGREVWFPAILSSSAAVQDDILGVWDTTLVPDGINEMRLTVNLSGGGQAVNDTVSPIRIENTPPPWVEIDVTAEPTQSVIPSTPVPQPTVPPTEDPTPRATVITPNGNVRQGDGTNYGIVSSLTEGTSVEIVGISNTGSGWYQVRLPDGRLGWMAPSIISISGNVSGLPRVQPPPPPATPIPTAVPATPTPITQANLVAGIVVLDPGTPTCAQTFNVGFDVANLGTQATAASGTISLVDVRAADGTTQGTTIGGFPVLQPGETFRVNMPLTISTYYNETHRIQLVIDPSNQNPETNPDDNSRTVEYTLQKGSCP